MQKHYFKLSQDHNCTVSAVQVSKTRASSVLSDHRIRFKRRERSLSVLYLIKLVFHKRISSREAISFFIVKIEKHLLKIQLVPAENL